MQLLDFISNRLPKAVPNSLLQSLQDIANNIQIQSNFCIHHPNYKPLYLPTEAVTRFQCLPRELQDKFLKLQLQSFLDGIYYNGAMRAALALETVTGGVAAPPNLENNTFLGIDLEFCDRLHQSNCGEGYFNSGWRMVREESDGSLAVIKDGLMLHIKRDRHLKTSEQSAAVGNVVAIRMPKNLIEKGYYVAVGNAGRGDRKQPDINSTTVGTYFHLTSEGSVAVMASLTQQLNEIDIPFNFKVLYNPDNYQCYDSGVLYFERSYYPIVQQVLQSVYAENQSYFQTQIPLFTKQLAPGLAVAEEPNRKFSEQESFGMNRCQIVANGLLEVWHKGDNSPESRINSILQNFSRWGIDWQHPYLNANSEDIYTPLDLSKEIR